jgi:hypothetical protein
MGGAGPGVRRPDPRRARVESFSPDGATLATSSADVTLLWDLDPDTWRARACDIAGRNLTELERREYLPMGPRRAPPATSRGGTCRTSSMYASGLGCVCGHGAVPG